MYDECGKTVTLTIEASQVSNEAYQRLNNLLARRSLTIRGVKINIQMSDTYNKSSLTYNAHLTCGSGGLIASSRPGGGRFFPAGQARGGAGLRREGANYEL
jgi:hypothetical protein